MKEIIIKLFEVLNLIKGFTYGYSTRTMCDGKALIEYNGKRYVLELREIEHPSKDISKDLMNLQYL